jgi:ribosomal subunit interface protein
MNIFIRGHETDVHPRWREHIHDRLAKLERFEEKIIRIEFVLTVSHHHLKGNETCHIIVKVPRKTIDIKKTAETMIEAIDTASKVLERQVQNLYKDVKDRNRRAREVRRAKRGVLA